MSFQSCLLNQSWNNFGLHAFITQLQAWSYLFLVLYV
uniref:Uncharacterized protein n=1 Tax=Arundo donax TaxID=35708 RepID=A0A0A9H2P3_ARUDO